MPRRARNGLLTSTVLDSVSTTYQHNAFGEPIANTATIGSNDAVQMSYTRDKLGRITSKTEVVDGQTIEDNYEYDLAGRLVSMTRNGQTTTWAYDANGNRTHENGQPVASHDEQDRLVSYAGASYDYTANGELKSKTASGVTTTYNYDELGNLMQVTLPGDLTINYLVDGRNRRIGKKVNGTLTQGFLYQDQLNPIAELDGSGNVVTRFIYADKINVPAYMIRDGRDYRIINDHLGSPRLIVDTDTGEVAQRIEYDVWGNITEDTNPGFQPFGFAGGFYDQHTGLVRFGARDYDPVTARWTSKDPIRFAGGDANLYGYVLGDPVNFIDPTGEIVHVGVGAGIGFAAGFVGALVTGSSLGDAFVSGLGGAFVGGATAAMPWVGGALIGGATNAGAQVINILRDDAKSLRCDFNVGSVIGAMIGGRMALDRTKTFGNTIPEQVVAGQIGFMFDAAGAGVGALIWKNKCD